MIILARVDNRLIHGQILEAWMPHLKARAIVVADDEAKKSPLARAAMTLALPPEIACTITGIDEIDWKAIAESPEPTLVLFRDIADVRRAVAAGMTPERVSRINLGNVHFAVGRKPVTPSVFLSSAELEGVRELAALGFELEARAIPSDKPAGAREIEERYNDAG